MLQRRATRLVVMPRGTCGCYGNFVKLRWRVVLVTKNASGFCKWAMLLLHFFIYENCNLQTHKFVSILILAS